ncbi:MAG: hypothetical protein JWP97_6720 [Labilithrix sp.]|nr:hypothetical protein [Labilithrix sp.]
MSARIAKGVAVVEKLGICLVYPIDNAPEPPSLWSALHPGRKMEWSWDADADPRVAELWHLRERMARSSEVAYAKWFRGRATFFSLPVFHALLGRISAAGDPLVGLPHESLEILERLREVSPRSSKDLRAEVGLTGKSFERVFTQAMKALWTRLLLVGTGEIPDGAFPSLAVAATEMMFEDTWNARGEVPKGADAALDAALARSPAFAKELGRSVKAVREANARRFDEDDLLG